MTRWQIKEKCDRMSLPLASFKLDLRRQWECAHCHRQRWAGGNVAQVACDCGAQQVPPVVNWMKLIQDGPPHRFYLPQPRKDRGMPSGSELPADPLPTETKLPPETS